MNKTITAFLIIIVVHCCLLFSSTVQAAACWVNGGSTISGKIQGPIKLDVKSHSAPGTVIKEVPISLSGNFQYKCNNGVQSKNMTEYTRSMYIQKDTGIYATEIPGIGVRVTWNNTIVPGSVSQSASCTSGCTVNAANGKIEFIQTGRVSDRSTTIPSGRLVEGEITNTTDSTRLVFLTIDIAEVSILLSSCTISHTPHTVELGEIALSTFKTSATGGPKVDYSIIVKCDQPSDIGITYTPVNSIFSGGTGLIGIDDFEGSAKNFAIKLWSKNGYIVSALALEKEVKNQGESDYEFKYQAQIVAHGSKDVLSAGKVTSGLMYTLTTY
ncbi:fimbrial protein [Enterobacter kobei]|uniref:fimbrial protein n=1 Tax=Enterobacter kobei TaxID=208224 RepID=UPI003A97086C